MELDVIWNKPEIDIAGSMYVYWRELIGYLIWAQSDKYTFRYVSMEEYC